MDVAAALAPPSESRTVARAYPRASAAAAVAGGFVAAVALASLVFEVPLSHTGVPGYVARFSLYRLLSALTFGALGALLAARRPRNAIGWLFLAMAFLHATSVATEGLGLAGAWQQWDVPGAPWLLWVGEWSAIPAYWIVPIVLCLCPDGRVPSPRWRPVVWAAAAATVTSTVAWALLPYAQSDIRTHPAGFVSPALTWSHAADLQSLGALLGAAVVAAAIWSFVVRYRSSDGVERVQVKWVAVGGVATVFVLGAAFFEPGPGGWVIAFSAIPLPAAIAVAILRHGLWDIDVVINRAVLYGTLTVAVVAVYALVVTVLGDVAGRTTGAPLVATALVAVGAHPLRQRLGRAVNRLVYGYRDEPAEVLRAVTARLDAAAGADDPLPDAVASLAQVLRLPYAAVAVDGTTVAVVGAPTGRATERVPLVFRGTVVGDLFVEPPKGATVTAAARRTVDDLARHLAVVVRAQQLAADVQRSRQRLVLAREEERRRVRRDLHDGLGPTLAAMALQVDRGRELATRDPDAAEQLLEGLSQRIRETVGNVRSIVEDLGTPELDDAGLAVAVHRLADRFTAAGLSVTVDIQSLPVDIPAAVEVAAYRIAGEALTNAARHAAAEGCMVSLGAHDGELHVRVADNGTGVAENARRGVGIDSMRQRAHELGGTFAVTDDDGRGTVVQASLPFTVA